MRPARPVARVASLALLAIAIATSLIAQDDGEAPAVPPCKPDSLKNYIALTDGCSVGPITFRFQNDFQSMNAPDSADIKVAPNADPPGLKYTFPVFKLPANDFGMASFTLTAKSSAMLASAQVTAKLTDPLFLQALLTTKYGTGDVLDSAELQLNGSKYMQATGDFIVPVTSCKVRYSLTVFEGEQDQQIAEFGFSGNFILAPKK
jgi:hypothetical protein